MIIANQNFTLQFGNENPDGGVFCDSPGLQDTCSLAYGKWLDNIFAAIDSTGRAFVGGYYLTDGFEFEIALLDAIISPDEAVHIPVFD